MDQKLASHTSFHTCILGPQTGLAYLGWPQTCRQRNTSEHISKNFHYFYWKLLLLSSQVWSECMHRLWRIMSWEKSSPCVTVVNVDTVDHRNVENKQTKEMLPHVWNSRISICSVSTKYVKRTLTISQKYLLNIKYVSIYLVKGALLYYSRDNFDIAFLHVIPVFAHHRFYAFLLLVCTIVHLILLMITLLWPEKCHFNEDFMHGH